MITSEISATTCKTIRSECRHREIFFKGRINPGESKTFATERKAIEKSISRKSEGIVFLCHFVLSPGGGREDSEPEKQRKNGTIYQSKKKG